MSSGSEGAGIVAAPCRAFVGGGINDRHRLAVWGGSIPMQSARWARTSVFCCLFMETKCGVRAARPWPHSSP